MTLPTLFITSFVMALSGALMPGPLLTAAISESIKRGFRAGPVLILGHGILEMALVIVLMVGLSPLLQTDTVFIIISLAGAIILLYMAFGMFKSLPALKLDLEVKDIQSRNKLVTTGILMSLANPYWTIWWVTIGLGYILRSMEYGLLAVAVFFTGHILADLIWYGFVTCMVEKGRHLISDNIYRIIVGVCASALIFFAVYFGVSGIQKW